MPFSPEHLLLALQPVPAAARCLIAYSGGVDSHVLLHALAALRPQLAQCSLHALHVDHGLSPLSSQWAGHCEQVCTALNIPCSVQKANAHAATGESPEAAARAGRYAAFAQIMQAGDVVLTAHHQDDQAETVLLQMLRGAGPRGLAGMPSWAPFGTGWLARPLLEFTRAELLAYADAQGLQWIEDHSNGDERFNRNFLRHRILPLVRARWPGYARTLARAARHSGVAADAIDVLARADAAAAVGDTPGTLSARGLLELPETRARAALRVWIESRGLPLPSTAQLAHVMQDLLAAPEDAQPRVTWPGAELRRYRAALHAMAPLLAHEAAREFHWDITQSLAIEGIGTLQARRAGGAGLKAALGATVAVRFRRGGERLRPVGRRETHTLKNLFQEAGVPPWRRDRVPLIYVNGRLALVAGYWMEETLAAGKDETGLVVHWEA